MSSNDREDFFSECLEDEGDSVLEIELSDFTDNAKNGEEFIDYLCEKLKESRKRRPLLNSKKNHRFNKVVFMLKKLYHLQLMKNFIDDLRSRKSSLTFLEEITEYMTTGCQLFWPENWFIHVLWIHYVGMPEDQVPNDIWTLPNIEVLCLSRQHLKELPSYVCKLRNLKVLNVAGNSLQRLPPTLCLCSKLTEIRVGGNRITSLPAYFKKLKNLKRIGRHDNYRERNGINMDVSERRGFPVMYVCDEDGEMLETNADNYNASNKMKITCPDSLFHLAAYSALRHGFKVFSNSGSMVLAKNIVDDITCMLPDLKFCDNCHRGFARKEYRIVKKMFKDFKGYKNNVFEAVVCSSVCSDAIFKEWTLIAEKETEEYRDVQCCFDVGDYTESDENNKTSLNTSNQNWFRNLFSRFKT